MEYAIFKRDGTYIKGNLPSKVEKDKFCIMCAAAFGAGLTAHKEYGGKIKKLVVYGENRDVIIKPFNEHLIAVVGTEKDADELINHLKS